MARAAGSTPRPRKTPAERAQADYDLAVKRQQSAQEKLAKAQESIASLQADVERTNAYVDYAGRNPDLPVQPTTEASDQSAPSDA